MGHQQIITYVPDGRKSYIQSVECLHDLLLPKFDDKMLEKSKKIENSIHQKYEDLKEIYRKEGQNTDLDEWLKIKVQIHRKLFQHLCLFLDRIGWLELVDLEE